MFAPMLWRIFQFIVAFAAGSLVIWLGDGEANGWIVGGFAVFCAFGATCLVSDAIDLYRWLIGSV